MIDNQNQFVRDVMQTKNFFLLDGIVSVEYAIQIAKTQNDIDVFIVNKRDDSDEFGLVLMSDIAKRVLSVNRAPARTNIYEIMSKPAFTVPAQMQIKYCARLFERFGISIAPVLDNGQIVGTVSYTNMVLRGMK